MPAFEDEVKKAREEGVTFRFLTLPTEASKENGKISLTCVRMKLGAPDESGRRQPVPKEGSEFTVSFDAVIRAIGEEPDRRLLPSGGRKGRAPVSASSILGQDLYGAGDFMNGSSTVIEAVASGREAASGDQWEPWGTGVGVGRASADTRFVSPAYEPSPRLTLTDVPVVERLGDMAMRTDRVLPSRKPGKRQAVASIAGAAVNPSDIAVALVAASGTIVTTKRSIDAVDFFAPDAMTSTVLDPDEMITEIRIPKMAEGSRQHYLKFTLRKPIDFAIVSVATVITATQDRCTEARIALGAVAPAPFRASEAEQRLVGRRLTEETASVAAEAAVAGAVPLSKNGYKIQITRALVKRAILGEDE